MNGFDRRVMLKTLASVAGAMALAPILTARGQTASEPASASAPATQENPFRMAKVGVRKISENIAMLMGAGGNIAVLHGKNGLLLVDAGLRDKGKDVVTASKGVGAGTIKYLINTHWHFDHAGGNEAVAKEGATIIAHENTRKYLGKEMEIEFYKMKLEASPEAARPAVTLADALTLHFAGQTIELTHLAPAHTDTDVIVHFKEDDVIHTGDLLFNGFFPFIDYGTGGNFDGMIAASDMIMKLAGEKTKIIPGHGFIAARGDVQTFRDMLAQVRDTIRPMVEAGKDAAAVAAARPLAKLDEKWGKGIFDADGFTALAYEVEKRRLKK